MQGRPYESRLTATFLTPAWASRAAASSVTSVPPVPIATGRPASVAYPRAVDIGAQERLAPARMSTGRPTAASRSIRALPCPVLSSRPSGFSPASM